MIDQPANQHTDGDSFVISLIVALLFPLKMIGLLIPKNNKVWVFGCSSGKYYKDNSQYLYEYVSKMPGYKAIWVTKNPLIINELIAKNNICYHFYSTKGIYYSLIAKSVFISYSYDDVSLFCYIFPLKTKIIQLYHGTPLKKLEVENRTLLNKTTRSILLHYIGRKFDYMFSASDLSSEKLNIFFQEEKGKYITTGYPRCDALFAKHKIKLLEGLREQQSFDKVITYLPTFREYRGDDFNLFDNYNFNIHKMGKILVKHKAILLIKLHPNDYAKTSHLINDFAQNKSIKIIKDSDINSDIYPLLTQTDILITDYSSVYLDYLLLDRPIIFSAFDKSEYESKDRGFYFNYEKVTPGDKVSDWDQVCASIDKSLVDDKYSSQRAEVNNQFNAMPDKRASARIFKYLETTINAKQ
jgi:CDP-glycerol glycerophosphotransferase (TagB/SpsB family)